MSTRCTIIYATDDGRTIHLYEDCLVDDMIYLHIHGEISFNCSPNHIELGIPAHVWEFIRSGTHSSFRNDLVGRTDEEIEAESRKDVGERIQDLRDGKKMLASFGWGLYGDPANPEEQQVQEGIAELKNRRTRLQELRGRLAKLVEKSAEAT